MTQQHLNGAQVGTGFQQMSREAVAKNMRMHVTLDPGTAPGMRAQVPDALLSMGWSGRCLEGNSQSFGFRQRQ